MHLISKTTDREDMLKKPPFGPGFRRDQVECADSMEVWGTGIKDVGEFTEFRLIKSGCSIYTKRVDGY
jgi:hypothetical protein